MLSVQLRSVGTGLVSEDFVLDRGAIFGVGDSPSALVDYFTGNGPMMGVSRLQPSDVLREITHLVESIPDWQLQLALCSPRRNLYSDVNAMRGRIGQGDSVVNDWALKSRCAWQAEKQETSAGNQQVGFSWRPLGFYFVPLAVKSL